MDSRPWILLHERTAFSATVGFYSRWPLGQRLFLTPADIWLGPRDHYWSFGPVTGRSVQLGLTVSYYWFVVARPVSASTDNAQLQCTTPRLFLSNSLLPEYQERWQVHTTLFVPCNQNSELELRPTCHDSCVPNMVGKA